MTERVLQLNEFQLSELDRLYLYEFLIKLCVRHDSRTENRAVNSKKVLAAADQFYTTWKNEWKQFALKNTWKSNNLEVAQHYTLALFKYAKDEVKLQALSSRDKGKQTGVQAGTKTPSKQGKNGKHSSGDKSKDDRRLGNADYLVDFLTDRLENHENEPYRAIMNHIALVIDRECKYFSPSIAGTRVHSRLGTPEMFDCEIDDIDC